MKKAFCVIVAGILGVACSGDMQQVNASSCAGEKAKASCSGPTLAKATKKVVGRAERSGQKNCERAKA